MKHFFKSAFLITALFTATPTYSAETQKLYLYTWSNFLDQKLFDKFTAETGIQIIAESMDSNEAAMAKLQTGASYDIVSASSYYVEPMIAAGLVMPIDFSKTLENWDQVSDFAANPDYDPHHYTVPNSFGTVGVVVNDRAI